MHHDLKGRLMKRLLVVLALLISFSAATAHAGGVSVDQSRVLDRWTFRVGGFLTGLSTELRLDNPITGEEGTSISLEDDLGFSSSEGVPRLNLALILGKRHQIAVGWYKTERDSTTTITEEIEWGDETFPINVNVGAFYDTEFLNFAYTYFFYTSETTSLGIIGGVVLATLGSGIGIQAAGEGIERSDDISTDIPVPQLGFTLNTYLGKKFVFSGKLGYIAFNLDDWEGSVASAIVGVEHRTWQNFGFGVGYAYSDYDIDTLAVDFLGKFQYTIGGFEIYARAAW